jgi:hypothetical protein
MLEGESPLGIAALPNRVVHGGCCTPGLGLPAEDGRRRRPPAGPALRV